MESIFDQIRTIQEHIGSIQNSNLSEANIVEHYVEEQASVQFSEDFFWEIDQLKQKLDTIKELAEKFNKSN